MIQIDMQMPKNCLECPVCNEYLCCAIPVGGRGWGENNVSEYSSCRPEWCPMTETVPVQPETKPSQRGIYAYVCGVCGWNLYEIRDTVHFEGRKLIHFCPSCGTPVKWE